MYRNTLKVFVTALVVGAAPAFAEVTPAEVWNSLRDYYSEAGYSVTVGKEDDSGDRLVLTDVKFDIEDPSANLSFTIPQMTLSDTGDAQVRTVVEGDISGSFTSPDPDPKDEIDQAIDLDVTMSAPGNEMISSGTPDEISHALNLPETTTKMQIAGVQSADGKAPVEIMTRGLKSVSNILLADTGSTETGQMTIDEMHVLVDASLPADEAKSRGKADIKADVTLTNLAGDVKAQVPGAQANWSEEIDKALQAGMTADFSSTVAEISGSLAVEQTDKEGAAQSSNTKFVSNDNVVAVALSKDSLDIDFKTAKQSVTMEMSNAPVPISYTVNEYATALKFPTSKSEEAQQFSVKHKAGGVAIAEDVWSLVDPEKKLPRDPMNLNIDLVGDVVLNNSLFDPALATQATTAETPKAEAPEEAAPDDKPADNPPDKNPSAEPTAASKPVPFDFKSLTVNDVSLNAAGADAKVKGTISKGEGAGQPVGNLTGEFKGLSQLLDNLVAMGLVPQEQAMGARMMLTMFAKPVEGDPNTLTTNFEFKEDGSIMANGQRIK